MKSLLKASLVIALLVSAGFLAIHTLNSRLEAKELEFERTLKNYEQCINPNPKEYEEYLKIAKKGIFNYRKSIDSSPKMTMYELMDKSGNIIGIASFRTESNCQSVHFRSSIDSLH